MSNQMTAREIQFWDSVHYHALDKAKALPKHSELQLFELIKDDIERPEEVSQARYEKMRASAIQEGYRAARRRATTGYRDPVRDAVQTESLKQIGVKS